MSRDERGATAITELVLLVPVFAVLVAFVVAVGRVTAANHDALGAARDAARAATLAATPADAVAVAETTAQDTLGAAGRCGALAVEVDTTAFRRGGQVAVTVHCTVSLADAAGLGLPGHRTLIARHVETIDPFRGGLP